MTTNDRPPRPVRAYIRIAFAGVALGTWSLFVRTPNIGPAWAATLVFGGIASLSALLLWVSPGRPDGAFRRRRTSEWCQVLALGALNALATWLYFVAIQRSDVAIAVSAHCLTPVFVALAAPWALGSPRQTRTVWLAVMATGGVLLMMSPWRYASTATETAVMLGGGALGTASAVFNSGVLLLHKRLTNVFGVAERLTYPALIAALLLFPAALYVEVRPAALADVLYLLAGAALIGVVGGWFLLRGLQDVPAEHAGILTLWEPLTGLMIAVAVWDERIGPVALVGATVVVAAGVLAFRGTSQE